MRSRPVLVCVGITGLLHVVTYLLNTQLPLRIVALGGRHAQIGWLFAMTTGVAMLLRPQVGGWTDRLGARAIMLPGAAVLLATMLGLSLARTPAALIGLMAGLGIANALLSTTGSIVVAAESPAARRGEALSLYYVASSAGVALGPVVGFTLADVGGLTLNLAVVTLLAAIVLALAISLRTTARRAAAPGRLGRLWSRHAVAASLALIAITTGQATVYAFLPLYAGARGLGRVAWFFPVMSGCTILCRLLLRQASDRLGRAPVLMPAMLSLALGNALLAAPPSVPTLTLSAALLGCGNSMLYPTLVALVVDRTPERERGLAIGTVSGAWDVGVALGSPAIAFLVEARGYPAGFLASALAASLGLAVFVFTERRRRPAAALALSD
ncbi:MAG TPA: MFS transporter [Methylomirabilota bacterium]|nr:MFS transporter [Methylomirabilota bacterium]